MDKRIEIYDSTLRGSLLSREVLYTVEDRMKIIGILDGLGISFVEVADLDHWPSEGEYFRRLAQLKLENAQLVVRGGTRAKDRSAAEDPRCKALMGADTPVVCIVGESWDVGVRDGKRVSLEENLRQIGDTITYFKRGGKMVLYVANHFFDGYKGNPSYARDTLRCAQDAGADRIILSEAGCGTFTHEVFHIFESISREIRTRMGIESHNDTGCGVANAMTAVRAGAWQVHGTFLGVGEGCGNTCLSTVIANLQLRMGYTCIKSSMLQELSRTAMYLSELCNANVPANTPYVGRDAFESRLDAPLQLNQARGGNGFNTVTPEMVGNTRALALFGAGNKALLWEKLSQLDSTITREAVQSKELVDFLNQRELLGYHYDSAEASLICHSMEKLGRFTSPYKILSLRLTHHDPAPQGWERVLVVLKMEIGGQIYNISEERSGLFAAIWQAIAQGLVKRYPYLAQLHFINYRIRLTESEHRSPRVGIEVSDGRGSWSTVGIGDDVITAILNAIADAFHYGILRGEGLGKK